MKYSIIIPTFNSESWILDCLDRLLPQIPAQTEIIVIDDCSVDNTKHLLEKIARNKSNVRILGTTENSGPGIARNVGIDCAHGEWLLFLDSDDYFHTDAFKNLDSFINGQKDDVTVIAFDWRYKENSATGSKYKFYYEGRADKSYFSENKEKLLEAYLEFRLDHSVIYHAIKRSFLNSQNIRFPAGLHEDIYFTYLTYKKTFRVHLFDKVLYIKNPREGSIVNTISFSHIEGFFNAYRRIWEGGLIKNNISEYEAFIKGVVALSATIIRKIIKYEASEGLRTLYYQQVAHYLKSFSLSEGRLSVKSDRYSLTVRGFMSRISQAESCTEQVTGEIDSFLREIEGKRWSCIDLHHSIFLAPNEIRTCCKRFFVDNKIRGDVVLLKNESIDKSENLSKSIFEAKENLFNAINRGESTDCDQCPYLEFKNWRPIQSSKITKISFEHHSVCNLKCSYCSDTYYGGLRARYDVNKLQKELLTSGRLDNTVLCIWGGGEPTADKNFSAQLEHITTALPHAKARIITNSVLFNETIFNLLKEERITVFTSIDAGTDHTFHKIRGKDSLAKVLTTLKKYSTASHKGLTVKYIFTEGNRTESEIHAFASLMKSSGLIECNFQISYDFKDQSIPFEDLVLIFKLFRLLMDFGAKVIYLDDLILMRVSTLEVKARLEIKSKLKRLGLWDVVVPFPDGGRVAIFGAGEAARLMLEHCIYFNDVSVDFFIDTDTQKIGKEFFGKEVHAPEKLLESNIAILIASIQNFSPIFHQLKLLGVPDDRILRGPII